MERRRIRDPTVRREESRILRLRSQARFAQDDTALRDRVRNFRNQPLRLLSSLLVVRQSLAEQTPQTYRLQALQCDSDARVLVADLCIAKTVERQNQRF